MAFIEEIAVSNLLFDGENPRLTTSSQCQRDILRTIVSHQKDKLRVLAEDILTYGLNPSELLVVRSSANQENRFIVIEGNRRLAALRVLENPNFAGNNVPSSVVKNLKRLSKRYQNVAIEKVPCVVVEDDGEARHWIEVKHLGPLDGAGTVLWEPDEKSRYRAKGGERPEIQLQVLDFLQKRGDISSESRKKVAVTTLRRLLGTPEVRLILGMEWSDHQLKALGDRDDVAKVLSHVVSDIATRKINVMSVHKKEQRIAYANSLPEDLVPAKIHSYGFGIPLNARDVERDQESGDEVQIQERLDRRKVNRPRPWLIPDECPLLVTDTRLGEIERELRKLRLETFANAVSVLFRVFLELSADCFVDQYSLPVSTDQPLSAKLHTVTNHLVKHNKLNEQEAKPARRAAQTDSFLGPSVTVMHNYVHNQHMFPGPADLRATWNDLQPWFMAVWPS